MQFLTDFADQQVMLPLSVVLAIALALSGWRRGAAVWLAVVTGLLACLAVLKVVLLACGQAWTHGALSSPSGHTASAALLYGGFCLLVLRPGGAWRHAVSLLPLLAAIVVGASRLALHDHTLAEVLAGGTLGTGAAFLLSRLAGPPPANFSIRWALAPVALVLLLLHGDRLQAELVLRHFTIAGLWPPASCQAAQPGPAAAGRTPLAVAPGL